MELYPKLVSDTVEEIAKVFRRVIQLREDDVAESDENLKLNGYQSGFRKATLTKTADYDVGLNDYAIDVDATAAGRTMTLAASPTDGETHIFSKTDASANTVTISGNGKNINGAATLVLATQYTSRTIIYMGGAGEWRIA